MNINVQPDVQGLFWACKTIWLLWCRKMSRQNFCRLVLRLHLKVNLRSAGHQTEVDGHVAYDLKTIIQGLCFQKHTDAYTQKLTNVVFLNITTKEILYKILKLLATWISIMCRCYSTRDSVPPPTPPHFAANNPPVSFSASFSSVSCDTVFCCSVSTNAEVMLKNPYSHSKK